MRNELKVGDTQAKPGEIAKGAVGSVEIADGSKVIVPLINVNGAEDGPILTVLSGVHGTELSGIGALLTAVKRIDPAKMRGALLCVTGANPLAFRNGEYITHIDKVNLSQALSQSWSLEREKASVTQRIAYYIRTEAIEKADYVIDMHANPLPSMPFVLMNTKVCPNEEIREKTDKIANAFGVTVINWPRTPAVSMRDICSTRGKPAITPELAGNIYLWESINEVGAKGILNVMRTIGMIDGSLEKQNVKRVEGDLQFFGWLYAQRGGFMFVKKEPGDRIAKGDTAIEIVNVYGDVVQEVTMPVNGYCWSFTGGLHETQAVSEGTKLAYVFAERSEFN